MVPNRLVRSAFSLMSFPRVSDRYPFKKRNKITVSQRANTHKPTVHMPLALAGANDNKTERNANEN